MVALSSSRVSPGQLRAVGALNSHITVPMCTQDLAALGYGADVLPAGTAVPECLSSAVIPVLACGDRTVPWAGSAAGADISEECV